MRPVSLKLTFVVLGLFIGSIWGVRLIGQSSAIPSHELAFYARKKEHFEIYRADADRALVVRLTSYFRDSIRPSWSPDGNQIAFFMLRTDTDRVSGLYVMDADGVHPRLLSTALGQSVPVWLPDGQ